MAFVRLNKRHVILYYVMLSDGGLHLQAGSNLSFSPRDAMRKRAAQSLLSPGVCPPVTLVYQGLGKGFFCVRSDEC